MNIVQEVIDGTLFIKSLAGVEKFALVGSAMYMPAAKDVDFAALLDIFTDPDAMCDALERQGFDRCNGEEYGGMPDGWAAMRKGNLNLIFTAVPDWFDDYVLAMEVCKLLKLTDKKDRIAVCRVVRDKLSAEAARSATA